jgi:hypothetical protein
MPHARHDVQQGSYYEVSSSGPVLAANQIHSHDR